MGKWQNPCYRKYVYPKLVEAIIGKFGTPIIFFLLDQNNTVQFFPFTSRKKKIVSGNSQGRFLSSLLALNNFATTYLVSRYSHWLETKD